MTIKKSQYQPESLDKNKNFFDYPLNVKKKIIKSASKNTTKMQLEIMNKQLTYSKSKKPDKWYKEYGVCKELAQLRGYPEPKELDWNWICKLKNVDEIIDLVIVSSHFSGKLGGNVPVDESREVFKAVKEKIIKQTKQQILNLECLKEETKIDYIDEEGFKVINPFRAKYRNQLRNEIKEQINNLK